MGREVSQIYSLAIKPPFPRAAAKEARGCFEAGKDKLMAVSRDKRLGLMAVPIAVLAVLPASPGAAQQAGAATTADSASLIDPAAMAAMDKMSAALQTLPSFQVQSDVTSEVVLVTGQKIQFGGTVDVAVHRPDAFKVVSRADTQTREMYYNGKTFTIYAPKLGYYASFDAPSTIGLTLDKARTEHNIEVPLADLFTWGTDQTVRSRVKEAIVVRPERIGDRQCMHYAFRQEKVDWQVWIDQGAQPLPCKLVITSRTDEAMPQYTAVLNWTLNSVPEAASLAFQPPADAKRITMASAATLAKAEGEQ